MQRLERDESWLLFHKIAFPDQERQLPIMSGVGYEIWRKCEDIAQVIEIIASILSSKSTTEEWKHFLDVVMASVPDPVTAISTFLAITEQRGTWWHCFSWSSLLPMDYEFTKDHLFHLWRIQDAYCEIKDMTEEELYEHFTNFLRRGYILKSNGFRSVNYKFSALLCEVMRHEAGDEFCFIDKRTPIPTPNHRTVRHASFIVDHSWEPPSWLRRANKLQSLLFWPRKSGDSFSFSKISVYLSCMTDIKLLLAEAVHCESLPTFLVNFKKLQYLRLGAISSISLPEDIPALQKLLDCDTQYNETSTQKLEWYCGYSLTDGNLREDEEGIALLVRFCGFKKLTVRSEKFNEEIQSLKEASKIFESLSTKVSSFDEDEEEFKFLDRHQTLESLEIREWKEKMLPTWAVDELSIFLRSLISIQIANCIECQQLPGFNTLPHLNYLQLRGMYSLLDIVLSGEGNLTSAKSFYPSLNCLSLYDLPKLRGWKSDQRDDYQLILQQYHFPALTKIKVQRCPKLISVPSVPLLGSLEAIKINVTMVNHLLCPPMIVSPPSKDSQDFAKTSNHRRSLTEKLEIDGCNIDEGIWHGLRCLRSLKLNSLELASLPEELQFITTLEQLSLRWFTNLKVLPEWIGKLTRLHQLTIHYCPMLTTLPNADKSLSALEQLEIRYCPRLSKFPESFPKLKRLQVQEYSRLEQILGVSQNLEELEINSCNELNWETCNVEIDSSVRVWEGLKSLRSLKLTKMESLPKCLDFGKLPELRCLGIQKCPKLTALPESLRSLLHLEHFQIICCPGLTSLPQSFNYLTSINQLEIRGSPQLEKRCQKPNGPDWPLIRYIPNVICDEFALSR